jgi:hypothetical protein
MATLEFQRGSEVVVPATQPSELVLLCLQLLASRAHLPS